MFTVEKATPDVTEPFIPFYARLMAVELVMSDADLEHPDHPIILLIKRGFSARVIAPCIDMAIRLAKEAKRYATQHQPQFLSLSAH